MAQLSQGPCFLVTVSSYVRRKLESRRGGSDVAGRGLSGGVSMAEGVAPPLAERNRAAWVWASSAGADELRPRFKLLRASFRAADDCELVPVGCALDLGRSEFGGPWSKQTVHEAGRPSVTMRGVGPWRSQ